MISKSLAENNLYYIKFSGIVRARILHYFLYPVSSVSYSFHFEMLFLPELTNGKKTSGSYFRLPLIIQARHQVHLWQSQNPLIFNQVRPLDTLLRLTSHKRRQV